MATHITVTGGSSASDSLLVRNRTDADVNRLRRIEAERDAATEVEATGAKEQQDAEANPEERPSYTEPPAPSTPAQTQGFVRRPGAAFHRRNPVRGMPGANRKSNEWILVKPYGPAFQADSFHSNRSKPSGTGKPYLLAFPNAVYSPSGEQGAPAIAWSLNGDEDPNFAAQLLLNGLGLDETLYPWQSVATWGRRISGTKFSVDLLLPSGTYYLNMRFPLYTPSEHQGSVANKGVALFSLSSGLNQYGESVAESTLSLHEYNVQADVFAGPTIELGGQWRTLLVEITEGPILKVGFNNTQLFSVPLPEWINPDTDSFFSPYIASGLRLGTSGTAYLKNFRLNGKPLALS